MGDFMTISVLSSESGRWKSVRANFDAAKKAADAIEHLADCDATDRIHDLLDNATQSMYLTAIPDLGALAEKLEIVWKEELSSEGDYVASYKQRIIGDIRRNHLLAVGVDNEDASGGMDLGRVATAWADALQEYNQHAQCLETGPSDRSQYIKKSDIVALKDKAEAKLLSLDAPNLAAIIRKLELLWADERFDSVSHYCRCCIVRDLHRLECQIAN